MQTDVNLLPVYNHLYELNLDDEEIERISTKAEKLESLPYTYSFIANKTLVRIFPRDRYWRRSANIELIPYTEEDGVSMDNGRDNKEDFYNKDLIPNVPCYTVDEFDESFIFKDIDVMKMSDEDAKIFPVGLSMLRAKHQKSKKNPRSHIINSVEEVKQEIKDTFLNTMVSDDYVDRYIYRPTASEDVKNFDVFKWAFDVKSLPGAKIANRRSNLNYIFQFEEILETGNIRLAKATAPPYRYYSGDEEVYMVADFEHPAYNYLDKGREFYLNSRDIPNGHNGADIHNLPKLYFLNEDVKPPHNEEVMQDIQNRNTDKQAMLVDSLMIETVIKRFQRREEALNKQDEQRSKLREKFVNKLKQLQGSSNSLKMNGITIEEHAIEYEGQRLECNEIDMLNLVARYASNRGMNNLNFDTLSNDFFNKITDSFEYSMQQKTITGKIGEVDFELENRVKEDKNGHEMRSVYMNGRRIKKSEIGEILRRGVCFAEQAAFDSFTHQVSKCSLELHKYLNDGIQLNVYDDYKNSRIRFKIPLIRESGKNFIIIGEKKYGVSNSASLIKLENATYMHEVINTLLNPKVVKIDGPDDIALIILEGEELHKKDKNKNKEMIERVEKMFGIEVTQITNNGNRQRGYVIDGAMTKYFLDIGNTDKETVFDRLRVFSYPDMQYVCMIDKSVNQTGPSNLINRIYALHNDSMVAREIETLNLNQKQ